MTLPCPLHGAWGGLGVPFLLALEAYPMQPSPGLVKWGASRSGCLPEPWRCSVPSALGWQDPGAGSASGGPGAGLRCLLLGTISPRSSPRSARVASSSCCVSQCPMVSSTWKVSAGKGNEGSPCAASCPTVPRLAFSSPTLLCLFCPFQPLTHLSLIIACEP